MGLFEFFQSTGKYISPDDDAVRAAGEKGQQHSSYHKCIVIVSTLLGGIGAALGLAFGLLVGSDAKSGRDVRLAIMAPLMLGAAGILVGVAITCLFAPRQFLTGPMGKKWMKLIGTENVLVARIVCLLVALVITAPFAAIALLFFLVEK